MAKRNTPTHVGKTGEGEGQGQPAAKHPHARGEDEKAKASGRLEKETPPRTWGRLVSRNVLVGAFRNTPTHVGKTPQQAQRLPRNKKHPHARGEDFCTTACAVPDTETPPRTWGRRVICAVEGITLGNTPTHVGKTPFRYGVQVRVKKHPHARGEDNLTQYIASLPPETPPRTWGRLPS